MSENTLQDAVAAVAPEQEVVSAPAQEQEVQDVVETEVEDPTSIEQEQEETEHEENNKKPSIKALKEKMRRREETARQEAAYWKEVAMAKAAQVQQAQQGPTQAQILEAQKPNMMNYQSLDDYTTALADWRWGIKEAESKALSAQAEEQRKRDNYSSKVKTFAEQTPDFHEVMEEAAAEPLDDDGIIYNTIIESDVGPQIAHHLAKNPELVRSLRTMSPQRRLLQLGKLESKFETATAPVISKPAKNPAPAPVKPVTGKSTVSKNEYEMTPQELMRARNERDRAKLTKFK
jgi:hypothetical protein